MKPKGALLSEKASLKELYMTPNSTVFWKSVCSVLL